MANVPNRSLNGNTIFCHWPGTELLFPIPEKNNFKNNLAF